MQELILERFDAANEAAATPPTSTEPNGHSSPPPAKKAKKETKVKKEESDENDDEDGPSPKKKRKKDKGEMDDAELAAMLQAQENGRSRATRGGGMKRKAPVKKRAPKKKSADKIKADEDSELELNSDGEVKEKPKKGGFHKQYHLSAPLAELVGEPTVSLSTLHCSSIADFVCSFRGPKS